MQNFYDSLPSYVKVKAYVTQKIADGDWTAHTKIPTEQELAEQFKMARGTIRQALRDLVHEGVIYRQRAKGTFVCPTRYEYEIDSTHFITLLEDLKRKQVSFQTNFVSVQAEDVPERLKPILGADCKTVYKIKRTREISGRLIMLLEDYISADRYPEFPEHLTKSLVINEILEQQYNVKYGSGTRFLSAISANSEVASLLNLTLNSPVMFMESYIYDMAGIGILYANAYVDNTQVRFSIPLRSIGMLSKW